MHVQDLGIDILSNDGMHFVIRIRGTCTSSHWCADLSAASRKEEHSLSLLQ